MNETIGERLQVLRVQSGRSLGEVAEVIASDEATVAKVESGQRQPSLFELRLLADAFGWDLTALLGIERESRKAELAARLRSPEWRAGDWRFPAAG